MCYQLALLYSKVLNWDDGELKMNPLANLAQKTEINAYHKEIAETVQLLSKLTSNVVLSIDEMENFNSDLFDETDVDESDSEEDNNAVQNSVAISNSYHDITYDVCSKRIANLEFSRVTFIRFSIFFWRYVGTHVFHLCRQVWPF